MFPLADLQAAVACYQSSTSWMLCVSLHTFRTETTIWDWPAWMAIVLRVVKDGFMFPPPPPPPPPAFLRPPHVTDSSVSPIVMRKHWIQETVRNFLLSFLHVKLVSSTTVTQFSASSFMDILLFLIPPFLGLHCRQLHMQKFPNQLLKWELHPSVVLGRVVSPGWTDLCWLFPVPDGQISYRTTQNMNERKVSRGTVKATAVQPPCTQTNQGQD